MYFHAMPLNRVCFERVVPNPRFSDTDFKPMYRWLEQQLGYYPFFLAMAEDTDTIYTMTGFNASFKTRESVYNRKRDKLVSCRNLKKRPHQVLFRFKRDSLTELHHQDFDAWNIIINLHHSLQSELTKAPNLERRLKLWKRILLKPGWSDKQWFQKCLSDIHSVQATTPELDLRKAEAVYCKSRKAQRHLQSLGFQNVILYRVKRYQSPKPFVLTD